MTSCACVPNPEIITHIEVVSLQNPQVGILYDNVFFACCFRQMSDAKTVISPLKVPSSANKNLQYRTYQLILHMREDSVTKGYVKTSVIQHSKQSYTRKPDASGTHINIEETINTGKGCKKVSGASYLSFSREGEGECLRGDCMLCGTERE